MRGRVRAMIESVKRLVAAGLIATTGKPKETQMSDEQKKAEQAAFDAALAKAVEAATAKIAEQVAGQVQAAVKPLAEKLAAVEQTVKPAEKKGNTVSDADTPLTLKALNQVLAARDAQAAEAAQKTDAEKAARDAAARYAADKMKDLPAVYREKLPATADEPELSAAEQRIRGQFQADLKAAGVKLPDVGKKADASGGPGSLAPDVTKMSPTQKIAAGFEEAAAGAPKQ